MFGRLKNSRSLERVKAAGAVCFCHRVFYGGLTLAYGSGCLGLIDKEIIAAAVALIYAALTLRG